MCFQNGLKTIGGGGVYHLRCGVCLCLLLHPACGSGRGRKGPDCTHGTLGRRTRYDASWIMGLGN